MVGLYIFLNPFPATSIKEVIYYTVAATVILMHLTGRYKISFKAPLTLPLCLFLLWSLLGLFFAIDKAASGHDLFSHLIKLILLYYMLINYFEGQAKLEILSWLIIISGTIFSIALIVHWYVILGNSLYQRLGLSYKDYATSINGFLTVFTLALSIRQIRFQKSPLYKWILRVSIFCAAAASILSQARATIIAVVAVICIMNANRAKVVGAVVVLIAIFVLATPVKNRFLDQREYIPRIGQWLYTIEIMKDYPVFGIGYSVDTFRDDSRINRQEYMARLPMPYQQPAHPYWWPHNMFLSSAVRTGFIGGTFFLSIFVVSLGMCWRLIRQDENAYLRSWGLCGLATLTAFIIKGSLEPIFASFVENILFSNLAMITIAWHLQNPCE